MLEIKKTSSKSSGSFASYIKVDGLGVKMFDWRYDLTEIMTGLKQIGIRDAIKEFVLLKMVKGSPYAPRVERLEIIKYSKNLYGIAIVMEHIEGKELDKFKFGIKKSTQPTLNYFEKVVENDFYNRGVSIKDWHDLNVIVKTGTTKKHICKTDNGSYIPEQHLIRIDFSCGPYEKYCGITKQFPRSKFNRMVRKEAHKLFEGFNIDD